MRVHATGFCFDVVQAVAIEDTAGNVTGVHAVHAYPRTASVVIWYSPERCDTATVLAAIAEADTSLQSWCPRVPRTRLMSPRPLW
jgi:cation-transporting ATPase G